MCEFGWNNSNEFPDLAKLEFPTETMNKNSSIFKIFSVFETSGLAMEFKF